MTTNANQLPSRSHPKALPGGKNEGDASQEGSPSMEFLGKMALSGAAILAAGALAVGIGEKTWDAVSSSSRKPVPSVKALENARVQIPVTPITPEAANAGASALGGLIDPQVYKASSTAPGTEASNLNQAITDQGPDVPGKTFMVPVLDTKSLTPQQLHSPDFVVGKPVIK